MSACKQQDILQNIIFVKDPKTDKNPKTLQNKVS
jgi:hypothetical protein